VGTNEAGFQELPKFQAPDLVLGQHLLPVLQVFLLTLQSLPTQEAQLGWQRHLHLDLSLHVKDRHLRQNHWDPLGSASRFAL